MAIHAKAKFLVPAAGMVALMALAIPAAAQDYGYGNTETVIVNAPPFVEERGHLGGEIRTVSLSHEVRFDDLDLRTYWGAHELRNRIRFTARQECEQLDRFYPVEASTNMHPCYRTAVERAMVDADTAIRDAREDAYRE